MGLNSPLRLREGYCHATKSRNFCDAINGKEKA